MLGRLVQQFRKEGFFTHLLNPEENIWHISMDTMEISMQRIAETISVECTQEEETIVRQAWMEVISQINELAKAMKKPLGEEEVKKVIADNTEVSVLAASSVMKCLNHFVMIPDFKANSKEEAFQKLTSIIFESNPANVKDLELVRKAVNIRENSMPTGLDHGVAVPHGRTDAVNTIVGAVAIVDNSKNENGSIPDYETIDHSAIQIIIMTIAPESAQSPYLQLMAFLSRTVRDDNGYERLLACKTSDEMRKFFKALR
jgi:mannitol/fructose-specific phosphotransferase system IIA component (Ntr-type)